jgi:hypothetical protein
MFTLTWKWSVFLGETGGTFVNQLRKRATGVKPIDGYTDAQVTQAADVVEQLGQCNPMNENELDSTLINSICNKIKQGRELEARQAIEQAASPEARGWCIAALKSAATLICTCGPTVVKDATFNLLGCN